MDLSDRQAKGSSIYVLRKMRLFTDFATVTFVAGRQESKTYKMFM